jgi:hypothetical protein
MLTAASNHVLLFQDPSSNSLHFSLSKADAIQRWMGVSSTTSGDWSKPSPTGIHVDVGSNIVATKGFVAFIRDGELHLLRERNLDVHPRTWMDDMSPTLSTKSISEVVLPGSHQTGSYGINRRSSLVPGSNTWLKRLSKVPLLRRFALGVVASWSKTGSLSICEQLELGIRYLDISVTAGSTASPPIGRSNGVDIDDLTDDLWMENTLLSEPLSDAIQELAAFLRASPREIVILNVKHVSTLSDAHSKALVELLLTYLGNKLAPSRLGPNVTCAELWNEGYQVSLDA